VEEPVRGRDHDLKRGVYYGAIHSDLSKIQTNAVLSALEQRDILGILRKRPLSSISFTRALPKNWSGVYNHRSRSIEINSIRRVGVAFGAEFVPGKTYRFAEAAKNRIEAMRRSLLHEIAHHFQEIGGHAVARLAESGFNNVAAKPITGYAATTWSEYLSESWVAYNVAPDSLRSLDPIGYKMVEDVLASLRALR